MEAGTWPGDEEHAQEQDVTPSSDAIGGKGGKVRKGKGKGKDGKGLRGKAWGGKGANGFGNGKAWGDQSATGVEMRACHGCNEIGHVLSDCP